MPLLPKPYPDEVIGSVIARACLHTGLPLKRLLAQVYGVQRSYTSFLMACGVRRLASLSGTDPDELLQHHTVLPYVTAFIPKAVRRQIWNKALRVRDSSESLGSVTKNASHGVPVRRFCRQCLRQDMQAYGESYWRRSHLLPGVTSCAEHECRLVATNITVRGRTQTSNVALPHQAAMGPATATAPPHLERMVADLSRGLLDTDCQFEPDLSAYRREAMRIGYQLKTDNVYAAALGHDLKVLFGVLYLADAGCAWRSDQRQPWPELMVREAPGVTFTTVKHILLTVFLQVAVPNESALTATYRAPGTKPRNYAQLDARTAALFRQIVCATARRNERRTVQSILAEIGAWQAFRHQRILFPETRALVGDFRRSNVSERQMGRRTYRAKVD